MKTASKHKLHTLFYLVLLLCLQFQVTAQHVGDIQLNWLSGSDYNQSVGVSWGVPWKPGEVTSNQNFVLVNENGGRFPLQWWPMAYWPDGSLKWTGFASVLPYNDLQRLWLSVGEKGASQPIKGENEIEIFEYTDAYTISTGLIKCRIPKFGEFLLDSIVKRNTLVALRGQLKAIHQDGPDRELGKQPVQTEYTSRVDRVTLEQDGPTRAVFRIEGSHFSVEEGREWLPFIVRAYFYAEYDNIRLVHTVIYLSLIHI